MKRIKNIERRRWPHIGGWLSVMMFIGGLLSSCNNENIESINSFPDGKYPLQLILREILLMANVDFTKASADPEMFYKNQHLSAILRYGTIIISSLPLMILYPFIQKYFVKGVMIGSVKG